MPRSPSRFQALNAYVLRGRKKPKDLDHNENEFAPAKKTRMSSVSHTRKGDPSRQINLVTPSIRVYSTCI